MSAEAQRLGAAGLWGRNLPIWAALMVLLATTCAMAYVPLGALNTPIGLAIAAVKAGLVGALFMSLLRSSSLIRLAAAAGFFWLLILFALSLSDFLMRPGGG